MAEYAYRIFGKLADYSRNFPYNGGQKVYTVNFGVKEGEDNLPFEMTILAAAKQIRIFQHLYICMIGFIR